MTTGSQNQNTAAVLMPDRQVAGVTVRPWSFGTLVSVSPHLDAVIAAALSLNIDLDKLLARVLGQPGGKSYKVKPALVLRLVAQTLPAVREIILVSCDGLSREDIDAWPPSKVVTVLVEIFGANVDTVTDFFGEGGDGEAATAKMPSPPASSSSSAAATA